MKEEASELAWACGENKEVTYQFEDNFKPFLKMNDSCSYIATLENKLSKLKSGKTQLSGKEMVDALFVAKDDHMRHHLNEYYATSCEEEENHNENLADNLLQALLIGKLYPERQALTNEELVHLLTADKLSIANEHLDANPEDN